METAEMRRSTLQRKDRDELTEIATTLGKKPTSRARKGEIIDLILDLAAGGDGSSVEMPADDNGDDSSANGADGSTIGTAGTPDAGADTGADTSADKGADTASGAGPSGRDGSRDGPEPGNRRRRRRGRERENNRDNDDRWDGEPIPVSGHLELRPEGYGFLRVDGALPSKDDAYVPVKMVRQFSLRKGDHLAGTSRPANRNEKNPAMVEIESVNAGAPDSATGRPAFDDLVAVFPDERLVLAGKQSGDPTTRLMDLLTPMGKGQRALVASPPRAGKTTVLKNIIRSIETNHPDIELLVLLLDERPEEITDMIAWVERGEVVAAAFDRPTEELTTIAEMTLERAKRMVEDGKDVCLVVDGMTRLARGYNLEAPGGGRAAQGTLDRTAIHPSRRFLGAARNVEGGGSLTIIATISVDSDSATDEIIYEELGATANLELRLVRSAAVRRVYPAVDIARSGTHNEELLFDESELTEAQGLRRELAAVAQRDGAEPADDLRALLDKLG